MKRMPAAFVTDFGPFPAVEADDYTAALGELGKGLPRPAAIIAMSGHWEAGEALAVTAAEKPGVMHDYSGFPEEYYRLDYPCPGAPALAAEVAGMLVLGGFAAKTDVDRPIDHGVWVPLSRLYPQADIPVVQLSVPVGMDPRRIFELGRVLAPLRDRGILLLAAGALSHNLRRLKAKDSVPDAWAVAFDAWLAEVFERGDVEALFDYRTSAPSAELAVPTTEHFDPLFFILGSAEGERPEHLYRAIRFGTGLLRIFVLGMDQGGSQ